MLNRTMQWAGLGFVAAVSPAMAAINLSAASGVTQTFDSLPTSGTTTGLFSPVNTQVAIPGSSGFVGAKVGGTGTAENFVADTGASNAGALYSYGASGSSERALGSVASGTNAGAFGAEYVNDTGAAITSFTLSVDREQWRSSTTNANTLTFAYGISGGAATSSNFLSASLTALATFDLVGNNVVATNGALDGNANAITLTGTIPQALAPGQSLFIRWSDVDDTGSDAGLAADNVTLTAVSTPEPGTIALAGIASLATLVRRRATR